MMTPNMPSREGKPDMKSILERAAGPGLAEKEALVGVPKAMTAADLATVGRGEPAPCHRQTISPSEVKTSSPTILRHRGPQAKA